MYTRFSGDNGQSPARWLRTLKYELPPAFTAGQWLECVDGLLDGKAARWADKWPVIKQILSEQNVNSTPDDDVDIFKRLFLSRFTPADEGVEDVDHLVVTLRQNATESLEDYYRRAEDLLYASGGRDESYPATVTLSNSEKSNLSRVIRHYINGLHHSCLKSDLALQSDSLLQAYRTTRRDECRMLEMGEKEYVKMKNEDDP